MKKLFFTIFCLVAFKGLLIAASGDIVVSGFTAPTAANGTYVDQLDGTWFREAGAKDYVVLYDASVWAIQDTAKTPDVQATLSTSNTFDPEGEYTVVGDGEGDPIVEWWVGTPADPGYTNLVLLAKHNDNAATPVIVDSSATANNGELNDDGGAENTQDHDAVGHLNGAIDYDGAELRSEFAHNAAYVVGDDISVIAWVKPATLAVNDGFVAKFNADDNKREWAFSCGAVTAEKIAVHFGDTDGTYEGRKETDVSHLSTGSWQFVAFAFDGSEQECLIYYNGARRASTITSGLMPASINSESDVPLMTGCRLTDATPTDFFDGDIDIVAIYAECLTPEEVAWLYNGGDGREDIGPSVGPNMAVIMEAVRNANN